MTSILPQGSEGACEKDHGWQVSVCWASEIFKRENELKTTKNTVYHGLWSLTREEQEAPISAQLQFLHFLLSMEYFVIQNTQREQIQMIINTRTLGFYQFPRTYLHVSLGTDWDGLPAATTHHTREYRSGTQQVSKGCKRGC